MRETQLASLVFIILTISAFAKTTHSTIGIRKDPFKIQVTAKDTTIEGALLATKNALIKNKFISKNGINDSTFTATRTVDSAYFIADVLANKAEGKIKLTVSIIKIGMGNLSLQKLAAEIKAELEK